MYTPRTFRIDDAEELVAFMRRFSFCTLITPGDDDPLISHVPVLVDNDNGQIQLTGHLAAGNPHAAAMDGRTSIAIFNGPHSYVSPAWYVNTNEVPTWNYASVHASGTTRVFNDAQGLSTLVDRMIDTYESMYNSPWDRQLPDKYRRQQLNYITGFEIRAEKINGKYKLGQNRSQADQDRMVDQLEASTNEDSRALAAFIRRYRSD